MKSNLSGKLKPTASIDDEPINLLDLSNELDRVASYYECAFHAVSEACVDMESINAIQSVMLMAEEKLNDIKIRINCEYERRRLVEEATRTRKAA
jgi:hypothetical protein